MESAQSLRRTLGQFPRVSLADLPTRLDKLENLSRRLEVFGVFVKRDDQTGLAFGGNKARKLDFLMANVMDRGADCIITWAGVQSNWCRQVAAAAAKLDIRTVLALFKGPASPEGDDGNLLLDRIFDADIRVFDATGIDNMLEFESVRHIVDPIADEMRRAGLRPYVAPIGGSLVEASMTEPWGTLGYVEAFVELAEQAEQMGVGIDSIVLATGSGGTQAGLLAGAKLLSPATRIVGISVYAGKEKAAGYVRSAANSTLELLGSSVRVAKDDVIVLDDYLMEGYGVFVPEVGDAIGLIAESEGLLLDPVYTGKSMTAMLDLIEKGYFREGENVVFLHTGGTPALFPYRKQVLDHLARS